MQPETWVTLHSGHIGYTFPIKGECIYAMKGIFMMGVVQFIRSPLCVAILLGTAGTLVEATGIVGREAAIAHQRGGISFKSQMRIFSPLAAKYFIERKNQFLNFWIMNTIVDIESTLFRGQHFFKFHYFQKLRYC